MSNGGLVVPRWLLSACCLGMFLGAAGCSGQLRDKWREGLPLAHPVRGRVEYNGQPVEGAVVVFTTTLPGQSRSLSATGRTDATGSFALRTYRDRDGAIAGEHRVVISKTVFVSSSVKPLGPNQAGEILDAMVEKSLLPEKYRSPSDSGLRATVVAGGPNSFDFSLSDK